MTKQTDTTEVTFFIAVDEDGKYGVDSDVENARDDLCNETEGNCQDVYEVTISVPKAKAKLVHLGAIKVADDGATISVETVEAA